MVDCVENHSGGLDGFTGSRWPSQAEGRSCSGCADLESPRPLGRSKTEPQQGNSILGV